MDGRRATIHSRGGGNGGLSALVFAARAGVAFALHHLAPLSELSPVLMLEEALALATLLFDGEGVVSVMAVMVRRRVHSQLNGTFDGHRSVGAPTRHFVQRRDERFGGVVLLVVRMEALVDIDEHSGAAQIEKVALRVDEAGPGRHRVLNSSHGRVMGGARLRRR